jgi:Na+/H+ antiporter NhaA
MAAKVALILFGLFIGVILGITGMSLVFVSPFFTEAKALGDISNLVVAVGAVFTMGFTLWQHQQQLDLERQRSLAKVQIVGAPIQKAVSPVTTDASIEIQFQFLNSGSNPAAELRVRVFRCPICVSKHSMACSPLTMRW